jgi:hypothetical protein
VFNAFSSAVHARLAGWCATELTDVPQEFNGLLDIWRRPKEPACHAQAPDNSVNPLPAIRGIPRICEFVGP